MPVACSIFGPTWTKVWINMCAILLHFVSGHVSKKQVCIAPTRHKDWPNIKIWWRHKMRSVPFCMNGSFPPPPSGSWGGDLLNFSFTNCSTCIELASQSIPSRALLLTDTIFFLQSKKPLSTFFSVRPYGLHDSLCKLNFIQGLKIFLWIKRHQFSPLKCDRVFILIF